MRQVNQTMRYGDGRVMRNSLEECATVLSECKGIIEGSSKGKEKAAALMEKISALADSVGNALTAPMPNAKNKDFFDEYNEAYDAYAEDAYEDGIQMSDKGFGEWCFKGANIQGVNFSATAAKPAMVKDRFANDDEAKNEWHIFARDEEGNAEPFVDDSDAYNAWLYTDLNGVFDRTPWREKWTKIAAEKKAEEEKEKAEEEEKKRKEKELVKSLKAGTPNVDATPTIVLDWNKDLERTLAAILEVVDVQKLPLNVQSLIAHWTTTTNFYKEMQKEKEEAANSELNKLKEEYEEQQRKRMSE